MTRKEQMISEPESFTELLTQAFLDAGGAAAIAPPELERMKREAATEELEAIRNQETLNKGVEHGMIDGIGQVRLRVNQTLYHRVLVDEGLKAIWGNNPWLDPKFIEVVAREHPECRVAARVKTRIINPGWGAESAMADG